MRFLTKKLNKSALFEHSVVLASWLITASSFLRSGKWLFGFDLVTYTAPATKINFESWKKGTIPLWDPDSFGGVPFLGRMGAGAMYFPNILFILFDVHTALHVSTALHLLILAIGFLLLIRNGLRWKAPAGSIASIAILGSGFIAANSLSFDRLVAIAWLPWILYFIEHLLQRSKTGSSILGLTISTSAFVLGGHPQFVYLFGIFVILYVTIRLFETKSWSKLRHLGIAGVLVLGVTSLQLVATYFLNKSSPMAGPKSLDLLDNSALTLWPSNLWVGVTGNPFSNNPIAVTGSSEALAGIGIIASLLALFSIVHWLYHPKGLLVPLLTCTTILSLMLSVGPRWMPYRIAHSFIPGFSSGRVPGRLLMITLVSISLLAAYAVNQIVSKRIKWSELITTLLLWSSALVLLLLLPFTKPTTELYAWTGFVVALILLFALFQRPILVTLLCAMLTLTTVVELSIAQQNIRSNQTASSTALNNQTNQILDFVSKQRGRTIAITKDELGNFPYLIQTLRPNTHTLHQIKSIDGYDGGPWVQWRWINSLRVLTANDFNTYLTLRSQLSYPLETEVSARFGITWALVDTTIADSQALLSGWEGPIITSGDLELWNNPEAFTDARLYFASRLVDINSKDWRSLLTQNAALVESTEQELTCTDQSCRPQSVNYLSDNGDRITMRVDTSRPAILVAAQSWHPDWKVYVDNKLVPTFPVDGYLLGISINAGLSSIVMEFRPTWYEPLFVISLTSLLIAIFLAVRDRYPLEQSKVI